MPVAGVPTVVGLHSCAGAAPYLADLNHGVWHVSVPDRTSGRVELAYARKGPDGQLPSLSLPIGILSATAEAMLATEMYEEGPVSGTVADLAAVSLRVLADTVVCVGRLRRPRLQGGFVAFERPPGIEDPEALDAAVLLAILHIRHARDPSDVREPVTIGELEAWRRDH